MPAPKRPRPTLDDARRLSLKIRWAGTSYERTASLYSAEVVELLGPGRPLQEIRAAMVQRHMIEPLALKGNSPATINRKLSALSAMLRDACTHGLLEEVPTLPKRLRQSQRKDRVLSRQEEEAFMETFIRMGQPAAADVFAVLIDTALRWGELERLRGADYDRELSHLKVEITKTGRPRVVPLTQRASAALARNVGSREDPIFPFSYRQFRHLFETAKDTIGLGDDRQVTIHLLRHTCASRLAAKGIPLPQLQAFGGWTSLAALQRYVHLDVAALHGCARILEQDTPAPCPPLKIS